MSHILAILEALEFNVQLHEAIYPHADLSAGKLQSLYNKASAQTSQHNSEMIAAGRGDERPNETRTKTDPLSQKVNAHSDLWNSINTEISRRKHFHGKMNPLPKAHRQSFYGA